MLYLKYMGVNKVEVLKVRKLIKSYPTGTFVLNINDFTVEQGSITGLVGPNGAGKTTLLKLIVRLLFPADGQISLMEQPLNEQLIINNISYMPGEKSFYENMTLKQMLAFAARSVPHWSIDKAKSLLERFPLKTDKKISTLSYGEKTQLSAILTFAKDVPLLILDEPTSGLDPVMQERMLSLIREASPDKTIIFSSHQLNEVEETADTIAIIKAGQIIIKDNIDDLKANLFLLVADDSFNTQNLDIIAKHRQGENNIYIGRKDQPFIEGSYPSLEVNLKDIFLNVIEGEVKV